MRLVLSLRMRIHIASLNCRYVGMSYRYLFLNSSTVRVLTDGLETDANSALTTFKSPSSELISSTGGSAVVAFFAAVRSNRRVRTLVSFSGGHCQLCLALSPHAISLTFGLNVPRRAEILHPKSRSGCQSLNFHLSKNSSRSSSSVANAANSARSVGA